MYRLWYFAMLFGSIVLQQILLAPLADYLFAEPLLPIVLLVAFAVATGSTTAEGMGFFSGLIWGFAKMDSGLPQGADPLLLTVIAFVLARLRYHRFKAPSTLSLTIWTMLAVFFWGLGRMALQLVFVSSYRLSGLEALGEVAAVLLSAVYSGLLCLLLCPALRRLLLRWEWHGAN